MMKRIFRKIITIAVVTILIQQSFLCVYAGSNKEFNISSNELKDMTTQEKINMLDKASLEEFKSNYTEYKKLIRSIEDDQDIPEKERFKLIDSVVINKDIDSDQYSDDVNVDINMIKESELIQQNEYESVMPRAIPIDYEMRDYFESWTKITRNGVLSYSLDPKTSTRTIRSKAAEGWEALCQKYLNKDPDFVNTGGLKDQYYCHFDFALFKEFWNLEPSRPDVSYAATVAAKCNP